MGWKKEFKKFQKSNARKNSVFDYSEGESSIISWKAVFENVNFWTIENMNIIIEDYNLEIDDLIKYQRFPSRLSDGYIYEFKKFGIREDFDSYPCTSFFKYTYEYLSRRVGSYGATLIVTALTKYTYYTTFKFWKVFNFTFSSKDIDDYPLKRIFEVMQRVCVDALEGIIDKALMLMDDREIIPYKEHLLVEQIVDLGDEFTYHWSKMLDQVIDLTLEEYTYNYNHDRNYTSEQSYSSYNETLEFASNNSNYFEDNSEDFYEKTCTMVFNDEVNDAFNYFGITKMSSMDEFKKVYRKLAKQFHPDINSEPEAAYEMKKINVFKTIIEQYFDKYGLT
ncbi:hypothetical protein SHELI_v1c01780 [Spiroplasma helicoides]|uniref:J domain-containing protein n=1 Tax=Spiroplasma helicoides TaxID=216938 RepID=A0A1B3SJM0_9MOLU|nr:DnaJ domain-containing protein [Spiroplasma helicoides]AOG60133.1 hypothetical protein SHELI_v1c01780 [Spiroplasma helicoides]